MGMFGGKMMLGGKKKKEKKFVGMKNTILMHLPPFFFWFPLQNGCAYVGCGESHTDHSTVHSQVRDPRPY